MKIFLALILSLSIAHSFAQDSLSQNGDNVQLHAVIQTTNRPVPDQIKLVKEWMLQADSNHIRPSVIAKEVPNSGIVQATRFTKVSTQGDRTYVLVTVWKVAVQQGQLAADMIQAKGYQALRTNDRLLEQPLDFNALLRQHLGGSGSFKPEFVEAFAPLVEQEIMSQLAHLRRAVK